MIAYPVLRKESKNGEMKHAPDFRAKVALAALSGNKTAAELKGYAS